MVVDFPPSLYKAWDDFLQTLEDDITDDPEDYVWGEKSYYDEWESAWAVYEHAVLSDPCSVCEVFVKQDRCYDRYPPYVENCFYCSDEIY